MDPKAIDEVIQRRRTFKPASLSEREIPESELLAVLEAAWLVTDTFLHTAENKTRLENFKSTGKVDRKCWITQRDEKVRRAHQLVERQEVGLYDTFLVSDEKIDYPGDPHGSFENILLCRCFMVPVS